jgi:hypothetical protein
MNKTPKINNRMNSKANLCIVVVDMHGAERGQREDWLTLNAEFKAGFREPVGAMIARDRFQTRVGFFIQFHERTTNVSGQLVRALSTSASFKILLLLFHCF